MKVVARRSDLLATRVFDPVLKVAPSWMGRSQHRGEESAPSHARLRPATVDMSSPFG